MSMVSEPVTVLHVDDEPDVAELTATFLERENERFTVETASRAAEGLERIEEGDVDCIVSDYDMPGQNGIAFLESVREDYPEVPFILFTGKGSEAVASDAISAGVTDYLQKETGTEQYQLLAKRILDAVEYRYVKTAYREIFENIPDGIVIHDPEDGSIVDMNDQFAEMFGYGRDTLLETGFEAIHPDNPPYTLDHARRRIREAHRQGPVTFEWPGVTSADNRLWVEVHLTPADLHGETYVLAAVRDITERKEREKELQRKERRYQAIFNDPNILVGLIDTDGTVLDINQTAIDYIDATVADVSGEFFWDTPWFDHSEAVQDEVEEWIDRAASGEYVEFEVDLVRPDGSPYSIEGVFRPVMDDDGEVVSLIISDREITERKQRERELQQERDRFRAVFEEAFDAMVIADDDGQYVAANESAAELFGVPKEELHRQSIDEFLPQDYDFEEAWDTFQMDDRERGTIPLVRGNGESRIVEYAATADVTPGRHLSVLRDVTEQREREEHLQEQRARLEALFEHSPDMVSVHDADGTIHEVNHRVCEELGYSDGELVGKAVPEIDRTVDPAEARAFWADLPTCSTRTVQGRYERRDGTTFPVEVRLIRLDLEGKDRFLAVSRDISDRKERETELETIRERMEFALDATDSVIYEIDLDTQRETQHGPFTRLYGVSSDVVHTSTDFYEQCVHPEDREALSRMHHPSTLTEVDGTVECEFRTHPERGDIRWIQSEAYVRTGAEEGTRRLIGLDTDVTDRKHREEDLERDNERLDQFVSAVSHDLRNPLHVAQGRLDLVQAECESDHLPDLAQALGRMETLIDNLLAVAREGEQATDPRDVKLSSLGKRSWQSIETKGATLVTETDLEIRADTRRLQQMLENLFVNAIDHGDTDVTVTIGDMDDGFYVEDTGPGIPEEDREAVFEPGFSTSQSGTGFGLQIVKQIAAAHDWEIAVTSGADGGARFEITGIEQSAVPPSE